ncbi:MAG: cytochrome b/b6 domain-containing protein [Pararhizobium sp.]
MHAEVERSFARPPLADRYGLPTRLCHIGLALAVIAQLATSQFMEGPHPGRPQNLAFTIHEISGLTALFCAFCFWLVLAARRRDTPPALLFPWFSVRRIADVFRDLGRQFADLLRLRPPRYEDDSPLASAVHGLGLLLMSAMAVTGTVWFVAHLASIPRNPVLRFDMTIHHLFANLVWAYLIGHALLALLHHVAGQSSLTKMWSLRSS